MMRSSLPFAAKILAIIGLAVLYVPVTLMIIYSFNAGKLTSVWSGFSAKWYVALFQNDQLLTALGLSVIIAAGAATLSLVLGTLMALSL
jgi:putrescine transport system permease protein